MDRRQVGMMARRAGHPAPTSGKTAMPAEGDAAEGNAMRLAAADRPLPLSVRIAWTATTTAPRATGSARRRHRTTDPAFTRACRPAASHSTTERVRRS